MPHLVEGNATYAHVFPPLLWSLETHRDNPIRKRDQNIFWGLIFRNFWTLNGALGLILMTNVAKVVLVSAQGSFFKTTLGLSFSLIFVSFSVFHFNIPRFFFMNPTFELTLSFCFSGVLFLAPLHCPFLLRSFQPVSCHPLLQCTLLSFLAVSLFYASSLHVIFSSGLALPSCFFLVLVFVWFASDRCCHHFFSLGLFF